MCSSSRSLAAAVYSCLIRICSIATDVVPLSVSRPLPRNESCFRTVCWQLLFIWLHDSWWSKYATIFCSHVTDYMFLILVSGNTRFDVWSVSFQNLMIFAKRKEIFRRRRQWWNNKRVISHVFLGSTVLRGKWRSYVVATWHTSH
jgi:hypothetical protein